MHALGEGLEPLPSLVEGQVDQLRTVDGEQVERDELRGRLDAELADAGLGGVDALRQGLPVEVLGAALAGTEDDLAVEHDRVVASAELLAERVDELREVPGEGLRAAAADLDVVAVDGDDAAEAVPLRLVPQAAAHAVGIGDGGDGLGEHRCDLHGTCLLAVPTGSGREARCGLRSVTGGRYGGAVTTVPPPAAPAPDPISPVQAAALRDGVLPPVEEVRPGIWTIAVPFRSGVADATLAYVVEGTDGVLTVIDPGWASDDGPEVLRAGLRDIGRSVDDIGLVVVTHLHADHLGAAAAIRRASAPGSRCTGSRSRPCAASTTTPSRTTRTSRPGACRTTCARAWSPPGGAGGASGSAGRRNPSPTCSSRTAISCRRRPRAPGALDPRAHRRPSVLRRRGGRSALHRRPRAAADQLRDRAGRPDRCEPARAVPRLARATRGLRRPRGLPGHEYRFRDVVTRVRALVRHREERTCHVAVRSTTCRRRRCSRWRPACRSAAGSTRCRASCSRAPSRRRPSTWTCSAAVTRSAGLTVLHDRFQRGSRPQLRAIGSR